MTKGHAMIYISQHKKLPVERNERHTKKTSVIYDLDRNRFKMTTLMKPFKLQEQTSSLIELRW